ncbi:glycoside hydrolase family 3 N-terminal domain-containing protein [Borrelia persica]|uniref:glycoside hydrolase family 3 N-terminal domain-containing protein n=1 Tax=Borrelia persica TaxID=44448 RepID=UPI00046562EB|nr:glycoside hydrolase family 3 N-terminal domain-containing protein [Borrelia persica]
MCKLKLFVFLFFSFIVLGAIPEIDYDYFESDKFDLIDVDKFLGKVSFKDILNQNCIFIGIRNVSNPGAVQSLTKSELVKIQEIDPVGVILFRENFKDAKQTKELIGQLREYLGSEILIAVDEEGGLVSRASENEQLGVYNFPSMEFVGKTGDVQLAYKIGEILGKQLRRLGINVNMAPVADAKLTPDSPLGNRTFGHSFYNIGLMVEAFVDGIQREGVFAVVKHFPGLGGTKVDTHKDLALLPYSKNFLMLNNFVPFVFGKEAKFLMLAHVLVPKISKDVSSMSKDIVDIVRNSLNIFSIIMTDAYDMGAIVNNFSLEHAIKKSLNSGIDIVLIPEGFTGFDIEK